MDIKLWGEKKLIILIGGLFLASFFFLSAPQALAYNNQTVHPDLIRETIAFYELSMGKKMTDEQKQWVAQGSIDEDKTPRWLNHFYDPAFERGLSATGAGFGYAGYSAKNWAQFSSYQTLNPANIANLWTGNGPVISGSWWGDFSYEAAIKHYSQSKEKEAYIALGNVLHVIEDMTVPEHVRNEAHPGGSFYETWAMNNSAGLTQDLGKRVFNQGWKPIVYGGLETYFNELAGYTNKYFFSPETINSELYQKPKIIFDDGTFAYGYDENYQLFDLAEISIDKSRNKGYLIKSDQVLQEYWTRLSRQAVINGAGIIHLFVNEAEAAKKVELAKQKVDASPTGSPQNSFIDFISGLFSSSPGEKSPEPVMTIIAGEPKTAAPKINSVAPKTTPAIQAPAASPPAPVVPKTNPIVVPKTTPAIQVPVVPPPASTPIPTPTPAPAPAQTYSGGGGGGSSNTTPQVTEQAAEQTFAAGDLVINEIMYNPDGADTTDGKSHEWIEIYNNSVSSVDLTGWKLNDGDGDTNHGLNVPPENGGQGLMSIPAASYIIITAHAETFLADHAGFTGAVVDTANGVSLKNSTSTIKIAAPNGTTIDEVTYYNSWGGNGDGKTLERRTASGASGAATNWGISSAVGGTPGSANNPIVAGEGGPIDSDDITDSATSTISVGLGTDVSATTTISQNTTWTLANSPYRLFFDGQRRPTVAAGAVLTIEPGVKIIPWSVGAATIMEIKGTLQAVATSGAPIIFTSLADADNLASTTPQKGDWLNIVFSAGARGNLDYVEFRYGGGQDIVLPLHEMVNVVGAAISINHSKFENSKNTALHLMDSSGAVENSTFSDNNCGISVDSINGTAYVAYGGCYGIHTTGLILSSADLQIKNNQFIRNQLIGIEIRSGTTPTIDNNIFAGNNYPIKIENAYPSITNSQISTTSPNIINGIAISGYTHFSHNFTLKKDLPYILETNGPAWAPYIDTGVVLTIEPGAIFKTNNTGSALFVNGSLIASTTPDNPIIFTSLKDNPQNGDWGNIRFNAGSYGNLTNVGFYYGGYGYVAPPPTPVVNQNTWTNDQNCDVGYCDSVLQQFTANSNSAGETTMTINAGNSGIGTSTISVDLHNDNNNTWGALISNLGVVNLRNYVEEKTINITADFVSGQKYWISLSKVSGGSITIHYRKNQNNYGIQGQIKNGVFTDRRPDGLYLIIRSNGNNNPNASMLSIDAGATVVVE